MSVGTDRDESSRSRRGVYGISVASELSGFGMQALRLYEQHGLVTPARTEGGTRRYSDDDLLRLERIAELIEAGVNLVGIRRVLDLESRTGELERDNRRLEAANARLREERRRAMHDPFDIAPEADRIEQDLPADPGDLSADDVGDRSWDAPEADTLEQDIPVGPAGEPGVTAEPALEVPEGDLLEQATPAQFDDDRDAYEEGE